LSEALKRRVLKIVKEAGRLISRHDSVFVFIDFQERLLPVIYEKEKILKNALRLAKFSRIIGLPVIITEQEKLGDTIAELKKELPYARPIRKVHFNCFYCHEFEDSLHSLDRNVLILAGVEAHICIAQTALYGIRDFTINVVRDAISSRTPENCDIAVERMKEAEIIITSTEMAIYELLQRADTEEFKATLPLIK
jgi:nicotinamidase-related amidase